MSKLLLSDSYSISSLIGQLKTETLHNIINLNRVMTWDLSW